MSQRSKNLATVGGIVALIGGFLLVVYLTRNRESDNASVDRTPVASVPVTTFFFEYDTNTLAADGKYKDKFVEVLGRVRIISKSEDGKPYIGFEVMAFTPIDPREYNNLPERERRWFDEGAYPANVIGFIDSVAVDQFTPLKQNQTVKVVGKVIGRKSNPEVWHGYVVELTDCRLASIIVSK